MSPSTNFGGRFGSQKPRGDPSGLLLSWPVFGGIVVGRSTGSDNKAYLIWGIREAQKGRIPVGRRKSALREGVTFKVLSLRMESDLVDKLDEAWKRQGPHSRMDLFRKSLQAFLATSGEADAFDLAEIEDGTYRESFPNLTMDPDHARYVERFVNDERSGSVLIRVIDQLLPGAAVPDVQTVQLAGGNDGLVGLDDTDFVGSEAGKTGLRALDQVQDLSLQLVPGRATAAVRHAMVAYCEVDRDGAVFAILNPPENQSATDIVTYVTSTAALGELSEFAAIYSPRVLALNPAKSVLGLGDKLAVPPSGIIAGVFARSDSARPGGVYDPPAGIDKGRMFGVLGFETDEVPEDAKRGLAYPKRTNPLLTGLGLPRYIDGSRTLKASGNFAYVAERRGVIFIERSLKQGLQFARHKNNTEGLRAQVRRTITAFLLTQMNNGAFTISSSWCRSHLVALSSFLKRRLKNPRYSRACDAS